ncbi:hypothetical protein SOVF_055100 [Spinacia oleracea]|uniref:KAT8 regulatory NSL complex subunit 2 n=1 Tax=Spinacia oleracea TaxID=3562 RepID=A0A9R0I6I1_SPIOL|nr:uncharacterized protein LOC110783408 isoform X2 [Spinacia oleracea]KNA20144.1 hypothetical protein SOVF_055100 [Spinacia oleracea]
MEGPSGSGAPMADPDGDDSLLANSEFLTRQEVMQRRERKLRKLADCYRDHYWSLMEEVRRKHREYYWTYGKSPCKEEGDEGEERENGVANGSLVNGNGVSNGGNGVVNGSNDDDVGGGNKLEVGFKHCSYNGCEGKAMALTQFCILHIMHDKKQVLYIKCKYPKLRDDGRLGSLLCNKAILNSTSPPFCNKHTLEAKKHISQALKKNGVSATLSNKVASKFHLVVNEYVQLIQSKRRDIARRNMGNLQ